MPDKDKILLTGGLGLIGSALARKLKRESIACEIFDVAATGTAGDICHPQALANRMKGCTGVVHLAAVSRVIWAQADPEKCMRVNVEGTRNVLSAAAACTPGKRPWVLYASSREIYGNAATLPANEDCSAAPLNPYGRSKVAAEALTIKAREAGLVTGIARFSSVYGSIEDHSDRVVPAFARAAAFGGRMLVEGPGNLFDFTHVDDVVEGIFSYCELLREERKCPPIHFVSGQPTTLGELAELAAGLGGGGAEIQYVAPRSFDVAKFCGDPSRARALLGWEATTPLVDGLDVLIGAFGERTAVRRRRLADKAERTLEAGKIEPAGLKASALEKRRRVAPDRNIV